jgi:hypothetical protein
LNCTNNSIEVLTDELVRIDPATGGVTVVGSLGEDARDIDLTLTPNGHLYGLNSVFQDRVDLWTIDQTSGAVTSITQVVGITSAEGLAHSGNDLKIGYSSGGNPTFSDQFADLSATGIISNAISFTVTNTGNDLDLDGLSVGLGNVPFYATDVFHPPSSDFTGLFTVDPAAIIATAIGTFSTPSVFANDLVPLGSDVFMIDHVNDVLHKVNPLTGSLDASVSLTGNGAYFGVAVAPSVVSEPATLVLLGFGVAGVVYRRRRKVNR